MDRRPRHLVSGYTSFWKLFISLEVILTSSSALAANGILRYILGAVFPLFTLQMYEKLGVHWAGSVFAFLSLPLIPIPWLLFKYGGKLRQRSSFVTA